ncbi:MAG: ATP-binding protein [Oscillospiraceae bacterium]|nr:ATP-binding protein [Oscillospiraceae bacterium]
MDLILLAAESFVLIFVADKILARRFHPAFIYVIFIGAHITRRLIITNEVWYVFALSAAIDALALFICHRRDIKRTVFLLVIFYVVTVCCELVIGAGMSLLFGDILFIDRVLLYTAGVIHKLILLLLAFLVLRFIQKWSFHKSWFADWLRYLPLPAGILIALIALYNMNYEDSAMFGQMLLLGILGFLTCMFMIAYVQYGGDKKRLAERLALTEKFKRSKKQYDMDMVALMRRCGRMAHDSRHHLEYVASLPSIAEIREYAARILNLGSFDIQITGNHDIDSILYPKQQKAREKGIGFTVTGLLPQSIDWLDPLDAVAILGNGLANAIEACEKIPGSSISAAFRLDRHLDIRIDNPFLENPVMKKSGWFHSTKKEPGHGIGMESIQAAADRYNGHMETVIENGVFSLRILLQAPASPE